MQPKIKGGSPRGKVVRGWLKKEAKKQPRRVKRRTTKKEARECPGRRKTSKRVK